MRRPRIASLVPIAALVAGCGTGVPSDNPYDPEGNGFKHPGTIRGQVLLAGRADQSGLMAHAWDGDGRRLDATEPTDAAGAFLIPDVGTGTYRLVVDVPVEFVPIERSGIQVLPGATVDVGLLTSSTLPPVGEIAGTVSLEQTAESPAGVLVVATRISGGVEQESHLDLADADGTYRFSELLPGDYEIRAERSGYTPDLVDWSISATRQANPESLHLYPASAVTLVRVEKPSGEVVVGARYTSSPDVRLVLLAFGGVTEMRISENAHMLQPDDSEVPWQDYLAEVPFTLSAGEGEKAIYSQFRSMHETRGERLRTEVYATTVVLDATPPDVLSFTINGGAPYLTDNDGIGAASLSFSGQDLLSGIDAYRYTTAPAFSTEPFIPLESVASVLTFSAGAVLGDADGSKTVLLELRDRADNVCDVQEASIFRDKTPPATTVPVISIDAEDLDGAGAANTLDVTLHFNVDGDRLGELLWMALADQPGLDGSATFIPLQDPWEYRLPTGPDSLSRQLCAIFKDDAGLLTEESCLDVVVDRSGGLTGTVLLEGVAAGGHGGTTVTVWNPQAPGQQYQTTTLGSGAFTVTGIPAGTGYVVEYDGGADYVAASVRDVTVLTGLDSDRGIIVLAVPRASVYGHVQLVDRGAGQYAGIAVSDDSGLITAITGPTGTFTIGGLAAQASSSYIFTARYDGYIEASFATVGNLQPGESRDLGAPLVLQRQRGDFGVCAGGDVSASPCPSIAYTSSRTVRLDVSSTLTQWRVSVDPTFGDDTDPFVAYNDAEIHTFTLDGGAADGAHTIYVQFSDGSTTDPPISGVVTLDTTPPTFDLATAVTIDPDATGVGATYNAHPTGAAIAALSATDALSGTSTVELVNALDSTTAPDFSAASPVPYQPRVNHSLDAGAQAEQWVYARFCDAVGNCTSVSDAGTTPRDSIIYDTIPPNSATIVVNNDDPLTNSNIVIVELYTADAVALRFGNTQGLAGADYIAVDPDSTIQFEHVFPLGDGNKTVYAQFKDLAGNATVTSPTNDFNDSITLDTLPPTGAGLEITSGPFTTVGSFDLRMTAADATDYLLHVGLTEDFSNESWQPFTGTSPTWTMDLNAVPLPTTAERTWNVFVRYRDAAGNTSATLTRQVIRDSTGPSGAVAACDSCLQDGSGTYYNDGTGGEVLLYVSGTDINGVREILVSIDSGTAASYAFVPLQPVFVSTDAGSHTVDVTLVDMAGNTAPAPRLTLSLDAAPPTITSFDFVPAGGQTNQTAAQLSLSATDADSAIRSYALFAADPGDCSSAAWQPYSGASIMGELTGSGRLYACVRDAAGNTAGPQATASSKVLDTEPPTGASISLGAGPLTRLVGTTATLSAVDGTGTPAELYIGGDVEDTADTLAWIGYKTSASITLTAAQGTKVVSVRFRDAAGNVSDTAIATTVLDTIGPTGASVEASADPTAGPNVILNLSAVDAATMTLSGDITNGGTTDYATSFDAVLTANTGTKSISVEFLDAAQNPTTASTTVFRDADPPTITTFDFVPTGGTTNASGVTLALAASDTDTSVSAYALFNADPGTCASATWSPYTGANLSWVFTGGDVWVCVRDAVGNTAGPTATSSSKILDTTPPDVGTVTLDGGLPYTSHAQREVTLVVTGGEAGGQVILSGDLDAASSGASAWVSPFSKTVTLSTGQGPKVVTAVLADAAGNRSIPFSTSITWDTGAPVISAVTVNDGGTFVKGVATLVSVTCYDAWSSPGELLLDVDDDDGGALPYSDDYADPVPVTLEGTEKAKTVTATCHDAAGNSASRTSDTFYLDVTPPVVTGVSINGGTAAEPTSDRSVTVNLAMSHTPVGFPYGIEAVALSETLTPCATAQYVYAPATTLSYLLSQGEAEKSVYVCARDLAGNTTATATQSSNTVLLDITPPDPGTLTLDGGANYSGNAQREVTATVTGGEAGGQVILSGDLAAGSGGSQPWVSPFNPTVVLSTGQGPKLVTAVLVDEAGNRSIPFSASITWDIGVPVITAVTVNDGGTFVTGVATLVSVTCQDAWSSQGELTLDVDDDDGGALPYSDDYADPVPVTLEGTEQAKTVTATCHDAAGNSASLSSDTFYLDVTPPTVSAVTMNGGTAAEPTNDRSVTVNLTMSHTPVDPPYGIDAVALSETLTPCASAQYVYAPTTTVSYLLSEGETEKSVYVCARDLAGNTTSIATQSGNTVLLDITPPDAGTLTLDGGAAYSNNLSRQVTAVVTGGEAGGEVILSGDLASGSGGSQPWVSPFNPTVTLSLGQGSKLVTAVLVDAAGNISTPFSQSIIWDTLEPELGDVVLAGGQSSVNTQTIAVSVTGTSAEYMAIYEDLGGGCDDPVCADGRFVPLASTSTLPLSGGVGTKNICWKFCDAAGNDTIEIAGSIYLDTYIDRPQPILTSISPLSHVAYSQGSYTITVTGRGIAADTTAQIGDFVRPCVSSGSSGCRADAQDGGCDDLATCGSSCECYSTCAESCTITLPADDAIMRNTGTYVLRLHTPQPTTGGVGTSANTVFFNVVGPVPHITEIWPRGVFQQLDGNGVPIAQDITVYVWGYDFMDNVGFKLGPNFGQVIDIQEIGPGLLGDPDRFVEVKVSTANLYPSHLQNYLFTAVNPAPGGGEFPRPFGINPVAVACDPAADCLSDLRRTRTELASGRAVFQQYQATGFAWGLYAWDQGTAAHSRDGNGVLMTRVTAHTAGGGVPMLPLHATFAVEDGLGSAPRLTLRAAEGRGSGSFGNRQDYNYGTYRTGFDVGDLDGDGNLDCVTANSQSNDISLVFGIGNGLFNPTTVELWMGSEVPYDVALADFNGDGNLDIAAGHDAGAPGKPWSLVGIRLGNGDGTFGAVLTRPSSGEGALSIAVGDVDHNGAVDMVVVSDTRDNLGVFLGFGDGTFAAVQTLPLGGGSQNPEAVELGDLDGDGNLDIVSANRSTNNLSVWLGTGDGSFPATCEIAVGSAPKDVDIADINGDGSADLVVANSSDNTLLVLENAGDGLCTSFSGQAPISVQAGVQSVQVGDLDGDGLPDLALGAYTAGAMGVVLQNADGSWQAESSLDAGNNVEEVMIRDLNGDGAPDLVASASAGTALTTYSGVVGDAAGGASTVAVAGSVFWVTAGDLNGDSNPDLVAASFGEVTVRLGTGGGAFAAESTYATPYYPVHVILADVDLDGDPDIVTANAATDDITTRLNDGTGAFPDGDRTDIPVGLNPEWVATADFNGDGLPDLVTANSDDGTVSLLLASSPGVFGGASPLAMGTMPEVVAAGDLNRDGFVDIITANWTTPSTIVVRLGDGDGTFGSQASTAEGYRPLTLELGDINEDGILDLIESSFGGSIIHQSTGVGDGSFVPGANVYAHRSPYAVSLADFDGDSHLDIVAAIPSSDEIGFFEGRGGTTTFGAEAIYSVGLSPEAAAIADFNADGAPDLVTANITSDDLTLLLRPAPGTWRQEISDMPAATQVIPGPITNRTFTVRQAKQYVDAIAVRVRIYDPSQSLDQLTIKLRSPRGDPDLVLDDTSCGASWAGKDVLQGHYPTTTLCAGTDLTTVNGWQPTGNWSLIISNASSQDMELQDFAVMTTGRFQLPVGDGDGANTAVALPALDAPFSRVIRDRTTGLHDVVDLSCVTTTGSPDKLYEFSLAADAVVSAKLVGSFDAVLGLGDGPCAAMTERACNDNGGHGKNPLILGQGLTAGDYCLVVDGAYNDNGTGGDPSDDHFPNGDYDLFLESGAASCDVAFDATSFINGDNLVVSTVGAANDESGTCASSNSGEVVVVVTPSASGTLTASTVNAGTTYDTLLSARTTCASAATEIACDDDDVGVQSTITLPVVAGVSYFVIAEGFSTSEGTFEMSLGLVP